MKNNFLKILQTDEAKRILSEPEIHQMTQNWGDGNIACLLNFNGIGNRDTEDIVKDFKLLAAFSTKDVEACERLLSVGASTGVRLDCGIPLYSTNLDTGEDMLIASVKAMLNMKTQHPIKNLVNSELHLSKELMLHIEKDKKHYYTEYELHQMAAYVNSAFLLRKLFKNANNKTVIQPNTEVVDYLLASENINHYTDINKNPVIVFMPGLIDIEAIPVAQLIRQAVSQGASINATGFFNVSAIVWSIILGGVETVETCLSLGASIHIEDEFTNTSLIDWIKAMEIAVSVSGNENYQQRIENIHNLVTNSWM